MNRSIARCTRRFARDDKGSSTIEMVLVIPVLFMIFMASFESGLMMLRSVMLDRATDIAMRELRLGHYANPNSDLLKEEICDRTVIVADCAESIRIELQPVSQTTWILPNTATTCLDRDEDIQPVLMFDVGGQNELMLVRVCVLQRGIFPGMGIGRGLAENSLGEYRVVATSSFVNEPS